MTEITKVDGIYLITFSLISIVQMILLRHDISGDTYIHLTFARNLATGYGFSYNRGEPSNASTSPLWSILLAVFYRIFHQSRVLIIARLVSGGFHVLTVILIYSFVNQIWPNSGFNAAIFAAFFWAINANAIDWAMRAMETALFIFLILLGAISFNIAVSSLSVPSALFAGVIFGLLILCRPEGWFWMFASICVFLVMVIFGDDNNKLYLVGAVMALTIGIVIFPYYFWLVSRFGTIFPSSRARIFHHRQFAEELGFLYYSRQAVKALIYGIYKSLVPFGVIGAVLLYYNESNILLNPALLILLIFSILAVVFYTVVIPGVDYGDRYVLPALPTVIIFAGIGLEILRYLPDYIQIIGILFILPPPVLRSVKEFWRNYRFMNNYVLGQEEPVRQKMAIWTRDNLPTQVTIAAKEIDQLAYYSKPGQKILSMDGTIGGEVLPYLMTNRLTEFLSCYRPTHLLVEGNIYLYYPFWISTKLATLAAHQCGMNTNAFCDVDGLCFVPIYEEYFFPYVDMKGKLSNEKCVWRLFSIAYPDE